MNFRLLLLNILLLSTFVFAQNRKVYVDTLKIWDGNGTTISDYNTVPFNSSGQLQTSGIADGSITSAKLEPSLRFKDSLYTIPYPVYRRGQSQSSTNFNSIKTAWNASPTLSDNVGEGATLFIPAGVYEITPFGAGLGLGFNYLKYSNMWGEGQKKSIFKLADNENSMLFSDSVHFNADISNIGFDGNKSNNTLGSDSALLDLSYVYNFSLKDFWIGNSASHALRIGPKVSEQNNSILLFNGETEQSGGWGTILDGILIGNVVQFSSEGNDSGGVLIKAEDVSYVRERGPIRVHGIYAENTPYAIGIRGHSGTVTEYVYCPDGTGVLIEKDTTTNASFTGRNANYSENNFIDLRHSSVDTFLAEIKPGNTNNIILADGLQRYKDLKGSVKDMDGRNIVTNWHVTSMQIPIFENATGTSYLNYTNPAKWSPTRDSVFVRRGNVYSEVMSYIENAAGDTMPAHLEIQAKDNPFVLVDTDSIAELENDYIYLLLKADANAYIQVSLYDLKNLKFYDFYSETWGATGNSMLLQGNAALQYFKVPFTTGSGASGDSVKIRLRIYFGTYATGYGAKTRLYYGNISNADNRGLVHVYNGKTIGYGMNGPARYTHATAPLANKLKPGTSFFCTDSLFNYTTNGTYWYNAIGDSVGQ